MYYNQITSHVTCFLIVTLSRRDVIVIQLAKKKKTSNSSITLRYHDVSFVVIKCKSAKRFDRLRLLARPAASLRRTDS